MRALIAQLDRAFGYGPKGWEFESLWVHHDCPINRLGNFSKIVAVVSFGVAMTTIFFLTIYGLCLPLQIVDEDYLNVPPNIF